MTDLIVVEGNAIRILNEVDLADSDQVQTYTKALLEVAESGATEIEIDFRQTNILSSNIITLAFLAVDTLKESGAKIRLLASIRHQRPLLTTGLANYVDLRLCG